MPGDMSEMLGLPPEIAQQIFQGMGTPPQYGGDLNDLAQQPGAMAPEGGMYPALMQDILRRIHNPDDVNPGPAPQVYPMPTAPTPLAPQMQPWRGPGGGLSGGNILRNILTLAKSASMGGPAVQKLRTQDTENQMAYQDQLQKARQLNEMKAEREGTRKDQREGRQTATELGVLGQLGKERAEKDRVQMENQREKERQAAQERLFKQQNQMEDKREKFREKAQTDREAWQLKMQNSREDKKDLATADKVYSPTFDSRERYRVMQDAKVKGDKGDQQADVNLVANHLGMTMGLQKGARITKDAWIEAQKSAPVLQRVEARFDDRGFLTGVVLTPQQREQMVGLAATRYKEDIEKSRGRADMMRVSHLEPKEFSKDYAALPETKGLDNAGEGTNKSGGLHPAAEEYLKKKGISVGKQ